MVLLSAIGRVTVYSLLSLIVLVNVSLYAGFYSGVIKADDAVDLRQAPAFRDARTPAQPTAVPTANAADRAELDASEAIPGIYVAPQGRQHTGAYPLRDRVAFCVEGAVKPTCYASNPPTSGLHVPVQGTVRLPDGQRLKLPPDPGVYDVEIPREAIPHIQEHAGVYIGYNCASDACRSAAERLKTLVGQENLIGARVVLSPDSDLATDEIGMASWTRYDRFSAADYSDDRVRTFIKANSCRFDPEGFCPIAPIN